MSYGGGSFSDSSHRGLPLPEVFGDAEPGWKGVKVFSKYWGDLEQVYQQYPESLVRLSRVDARSQSYLVKRLGG